MDDFYNTFMIHFWCFMELDSRSQFFVFQKKKLITPTCVGVISCNENNSNIQKMCVNVM